MQNILTISFLYDFKSSKVSKENRIIFRDYTGFVVDGGSVC